jgi:hypothetical protein
MMTPEEKQWWEGIRRKGPRRFILLYGMGGWGGAFGVFILWSAYNRDDDVFWFLGPIVGQRHFPSCNDGSPVLKTV